MYVHIVHVSFISPTGSDDSVAMERGCRGVTIPTLGEREMSLSSRKEVTGLFGRQGEGGGGGGGV